MIIRMSNILLGVIGLPIFAGPAHLQAAAHTETAHRAYALAIHCKQNTFKVGDEI